MMEYLVLLRRMAGFCYIADRFVRPSSAMATSPPEGNLSCQRCGSIIASTSDVVQVLSHPRTGSLLPQDLSAGSDGEGLFVSKTSNVKLGEEEGTVGVVPYGLRYRSLRCSGCSEVVGWRYQEGVDLRPSLLAYVGRSSLFTSRVLGQVASGDGYIMYEHFDKIPQSIEAGLQRDGGRVWSGAPAAHGLMLSFCHHHHHVFFSAAKVTARSSKIGRSYWWNICFSSMTF